MVSSCVCAGCTNSNLSGHRVHIFPSKKSPVFRSWVKFVQAKRQNFTAKSVHPKNSVICSGHFLEEDYVESDLVAFKMGYKSIRNVHLKTDAVPSVYVNAAVAANQQLPLGKLFWAGRIVQTASVNASAASFVSRTAGVDTLGSVKEVQELSEPVQTHADRSTQCNSEHPNHHRLSDVCQAAVARGGATSAVMAGLGNWDSVGGMEQITVVRIDDSHIAEEQSAVGGKVKGDVSKYYEVECSIPAEEEVAGEEEEDGVYVIEYSNPEEEGESYKFTMSVDRSPQARKPVTKPPAVREDATAASPFTPERLHQRRKMMAEEEKEMQSNKSVLELGENDGDEMENNSASGKKLVCPICPPPGKFFKRASGLAMHLKHSHTLEGKKQFFCTSCKRTVRSQIELDAHTKRHANQDAVFTCHLCSADPDHKAGYKGSRWGLRKHLAKEHPGVIPRCHICQKIFKTLALYVADQFRHVGVSPYYCARCQIYEMTERGLSVHIRNHDKKKKTELEAGGNHPLTLGVSSNAENSATDDSDF